jgi:hypothetical protein
MFLCSCRQLPRKARLSTLIIQDTQFVPYGEQQNSNGAILLRKRLKWESASCCRSPGDVMKGGGGRGDSVGGPAATSCNSSNERTTETIFHKETKEVT